MVSQASINTALNEIINHCDEESRLIAQTASVPVRFPAACTLQQCMSFRLLSVPFPFPRTTCCSTRIVLSDMSVLDELTISGMEGKTY